MILVLLHCYPVLALAGSSLICNKLPATGRKSVDPSHRPSIHNRLCWSYKRSAVAAVRPADGTAEYVTAVCSGLAHWRRRRTFSGRSTINRVFTIASAEGVVVVCIFNLTTWYVLTSTAYWSLIALIGRGHRPSACPSARVPLAFSARQQFRAKRRVFGGRSDL